MVAVFEVVELEVSRLLRDRVAVDGVRCRIQPGRVVLQIESGTALDFGDSQFDPCIDATTRIFSHAGYTEQVSEVTIEPYKRGSAFLIGTVEV